jgi:hypothetical protein
MRRCAKGKKNRQQKVFFFFKRIQWIAQSQKPEELRRDEGKWKLKRKEQRNFVKEATDS